MKWNDCDYCNNKTSYIEDNPFVEYRQPRPSDKSDMCCTMAGHMKCFGTENVSELVARAEGGIATPKQWVEWIESKEAMKAGFLFLS